MRHPLCVLSFGASPHFDKHTNAYLSREEFPLHDKPRLVQVQNLSTCRRRLKRKEVYQNLAERYSSIHTLKQTFGRNKHFLWGDLDGKNTRKLYHLLLPHFYLSLYENHQNHLHSETRDINIPLADLAYFSFQARKVAKRYARERCVLTGRIGSKLYDSIRSLKKWGTWSTTGMTYQQAWNKYEKEVLKEIELNGKHPTSIEPFEVQNMIHLKILNSSCRTNKMMDEKCLKNDVNKVGAKKRKNIRSDLEMKRIQEKVLNEAQEYRALMRYVSLSKHCIVWHSFRNKINLVP
eukprot:240499_1